MVIRVIVLFVLFLFNDELNAEIRLCSVNQIPEDVIELHFLSSNYVFNAGSLRVINKYNIKFLKNFKSKFIKYDINQHIKSLLDIVQRIQLPNKDLISIRSFIQRIKKNKFFQDSKDINNILVYIEARLIISNEELVRYVVKEIKTNQNIDFVNNLITLLVQRGLVKKIKGLESKLDIKLSKGMIDISLKKAEFNKELEKLITTGKLKHSIFIFNSIEKEILQFKSQSIDPYERLNKYKPPFFKWQIKQLGKFNYNSYIINILKTLKDNYIKQRKKPGIRNSFEKNLNNNIIYNTVKQAMNPFENYGVILAKRYCKNNISKTSK